MNGERAIPFASFSVGLRPKCIWLNWFRIHQLELLGDLSMVYHKQSLLLKLNDSKNQNLCINHAILTKVNYNTPQKIHGVLSFTQVISTENFPVNHSPSGHLTQAMENYPFRWSKSGFTFKEMVIFSRTWANHRAWFSFTISIIRPHDINVS